MSKKYVLMCDYGLDDAAATAFVLDNRKAGDSVDVMPIGGNSEKSVAYRNGQTLLARYEGSLDGVRVVDTREEEQPFANLPSIHGEDGMGDLFAPETSSVPVVKFAEWLKETDEIVLVSLGPCTLTEKIVAAREVSLLLVMGGCVDAEPNFHGYEFNHYLDIPAFNACMRFPHTAVATLDTCRVKRFNLIGKEIEGDGLTAIFLKRSRDLAAVRHPDNCYVYDYIAVHYLFENATIAVKTDRENNEIREIVFPEKPGARL